MKGMKLIFFFFFNLTRFDKVCLALGFSPLQKYFQVQIQTGKRILGQAQHENTEEILELNC